MNRSSQRFQAGGLHINLPKLEKKDVAWSDGAKASSFDDLLSGKTKDAGKIRGHKSHFFEIPRCLPPARVAFWSGRDPLLCWSSRERAGTIIHVATVFFYKLKPPKDSGAWYQVHAAYRLPRRACSRSSASNSALKLPLPKPRAPLRWMISTNSVGRSTIGLLKSCSR